MRRIIVRSQQRPDNDINKKRHSTLAIDNDNEEEHSSQPQCLTLLTNKLGIPPEKAEEACVATSFRSAQAAVDWLLQRHDDGKIVRREYILLLCPDERLNEQIRTFTGEANQYLINDSTSKDRQHLRAFKMSNFFHISDRYVYTFYKTIDVALRRFRNLNFPSTRINLHSTSDCLMLVPDGESKKMLEDLFETIKLLFGQAAPEVTVLPSRQPLHLTLAHGLHTSSLAQRSSLIALARVCIDFERVIDWQLRLYSREQFSTTAEIYRVIVPTSLSECLSLKLNDLFVVLDNNRLGEQALVFGRSHTTGEQGQYPLKNLRKTSEVEAWTLQKSSPLTNTNHGENSPTTNDLFESENNSVLPNSIDVNVNSNNVVRHSSRKPNTTSRFKPNHINGRLDVLSSTTSNPGLIRLFCIRHGERVDFAFGAAWPEQAFDKAGNYRRMNLNMPVALPRRRNPFRDFIADSPITEIGAAQARLTGEALAANNALAQYCYSSPSLRCIQTAHHILEGMGLEDRVKIRVEPGLFEFMGWYERGLPSFFSPSDSNNNNLSQEDDSIVFNLDKTYRPIIPLEKLSRDEKYTDYYNRSFKVTQQITDKHKLTGANIFFIGHAATLEVCTRQLCSLPLRSYSEFNSVIRRVSYLGVQLCERNPTDGQWTLKSPPIPPLQHSNNVQFDWQTMKQQQQQQPSQS